MEVALELLRELAKNDKLMWVVGGTGVVSENNSKGIKEPEVSGNHITMEADNWHFHLGLDDITGIQFVEAESHGDCSHTMSGSPVSKRIPWCGDISPTRI